MTDQRGASLTFLGATRQVTGSRYGLAAGGDQFLVDCGLFQERDLAARNWDDPPLAPNDVRKILLTHAHLDHCGLIPRFVKDGYRGEVLATPASIQLARIVLEDSGGIQEEDAKYKRRRHKREGRQGPHPEVPLYTKADAEAALGLFRLVPYGRQVTLNDAVTVRYHDAGHILGSALLDLTVHVGAETRRLVFSGDLGQWDRILMHDPTLLDHADYIVMESTYGDRRHAGTEATVLDDLARVVNETVERGGNIVIPTFAIDRAQELLYFLGELTHAKRIPRLTVFLDSPMAIEVTTVYKQYASLLDESTQSLFEAGRHPFQFPGLHFVQSPAQSQSINTLRGSCVILAGAGMCTGGRIKHHLRHNLPRPESTVVFTGFQAHGTLGRTIVDGEDPVRIHGRPVPVRARIESLSGLSAHADRDGLLRWLRGFQKPPRTLLTHGEEEVCLALAERVRTELGWTVEVPSFGDTFTL